MTSTVFTIGYGKWPAAQRSEKLVAALKVAGVELLVDVRHSPCSSSLNADNAYGPKETNLQAGEAGIMPLLARAGIGYLWVVELGNPQKNDPAMNVLKEHLAAPAEVGWPVARGLELVRALVLGGENGGLDVRVREVRGVPSQAGRRGFAQASTGRDEPPRPQRVTAVRARTPSPPNTNGFP